SGSQYASRSRRASSSAVVTGASGSASSVADPANAEGALYGEPPSPTGPSGSPCHQLCPASASQSTKANASSPSRPPGSEVGCNCTPPARGRGVDPEDRVIELEKVEKDRLSELP